MTSLLSALGLATPGVACLVGAGGKTTLLHRLAREAAGQGLRALCTTTTKMFPPAPGQCPGLVVSASIPEAAERASELLGVHGWAVAARALLPASGKLEGFGPAEVEALWDTGLFDLILVEADGAAGRPLKAPADHEPVAPEGAAAVVAVAGLDGLGRALGPDCAHRPELFGRLAGLGMGEAVDAAALARVLAHAQGSFKGCPDGARRVAFLNKADLPGAMDAAREVGRRLGELAWPDSAPVFAGSALDPDRPARRVHPLPEGRGGRVAGIVLGAGSSTRMGRAKQLMEWRGKPLLQWAVDAALGAGLDPVVVVLGHEAEAVRRACSLEGTVTVVNRSHSLGQSTSVRAGLAALDQDVDAALFLLGDQPLVTAREAGLVAEAFRDAGSPLVIPVHQGRRGNPVLVARELFPRVMEITGDVGPRALFQECGHLVREVEAGTDAILADVDTPADHDALPE